MGNTNGELNWIGRFTDYVSPAMQPVFKTIDTFKQKAQNAEVAVGKNFAGIKNAVKDFGVKNAEVIESVTSQIPGASGAIGMLANPYVAAGAAAVAGAALMAGATAKAAEFNSEFRKLANLNLDKTPAELKQLNSSVLNLALTTGQSAIKMSNAYFDVESATGEYGKSVETVLSKVSAYSIATQSDYNEAINSTLKSMTNFKIGTKDIDVILKANYATVQTGLVTYSKLAQVQTEYASSAAGANQTIGEANKLFSVFTQATKNADIAANVTKTTFDAFSDGKFIGVLDKLGVSVYDKHHKFKSLTEIVKGIVPVFGKMNDQQFNTVKDAIGGNEGLMMLMNMARTNGDKLLNTFAQFDKVLGGFDLNKQLQLANGDFTQLKQIVGEQVNTVLIMLGQKTLPYVAKAFAWIRDAIVWLKELWQQNVLVRDIVHAVGKIAVLAFNWMLMPIRRTWAMVKAVGSVLGWMAEKVGLGGGSFMSFYEKVRPVLSWLFDKVTAIWDIVTKIMSFDFKGAWDGIKNIFSGDKTDKPKPAPAPETKPTEPTNPVIAGKPAKDGAFVMPDFDEKKGKKGKGGGDGSGSGSGRSITIHNLTLAKEITIYANGVPDLERQASEIINRLLIKAVRDAEITLASDY